MIGDPADPLTEIGPLVNERQHDAVLRAIEQGRREGGVLLAGGERVGGPGYFVAPALFEGVDDRAALAREEVFGPVDVAVSLRDASRTPWREPTASSRGCRPRSSPAPSPPRSGSSTPHGPGSSTSTRRRPARRSTSRSAASRRRAGARTSRGEPGIEFYTDLATVYLDA